MAIENWQQPAMGAGAGFLSQGLPLLLEANRLKRERKRLMKEGAPGLSDLEKEQLERAKRQAEQPLTAEEQQQYAAAQARAASRLAPGYAQEMEGIAQQQADVLAAGKRGSATSSNLLNLLGRMNAQGQAQRRQLAIRGEQTQRQAQSELGRQTAYAGQAKRAAQAGLENLSMLADARREQRKRLWESQMANMDAARRQMILQAWSSPFTGGLAMMPTEGMKFTKGGPTAPGATPTGGGSILGPERETTPNYAAYGNTGAGMYGMDRGMYDYATGQYVDPITGVPIR